jgi:hypothetical protein
MFFDPRRVRRDFMASEGVLFMNAADSAHFRQINAQMVGDVRAFPGYNFFIDPIFLRDTWVQQFHRGYPLIVGVSTVLFPLKS